jgi:uncharacterized protein YciI
MKRVRTGSILATAFLLLAQTGASALQNEPKYEMGTFWLCMLVKGPKYTKEPTPETGAMMKGHLKHLEGLVEKGKAVLCGPFMDNDRISGLVIMTVPTAEEARALAEADPTVRAGHFAVEVLKWWAAKGIMKPPATPFQMGSMTRYYFGILRRGPKWSAEKTPESGKLQADHLANIRRLAEMGKMVIAGPFENAGEYAGVFVFKVQTIEEARTLAETDPAIQAGRLVIDIHPWIIPQGSLP